MKIAHARRASILSVLLTSAVLAWCASRDARLLAFVDRNTLALMIGKWDPAKGWVASDAFYQPPQPESPVTLYGPLGKLADVQIADLYRPSPTATPRDWTATVTRWNSREFQYALAVVGNWPEPIRRATALSVEDPAIRQVVAHYLHDHKLNVPEPLITQAYEVDLLGDGRKERLICAHSDESAQRDNKASPVYAVALLQAGDHVWPLASQTSFQSTIETIDEHNRHNGQRDFYRWLAFTDLNGDGKLDIALYEAKSNWTQVDVFTWDGERPKQVLSTYRLL